MTSSVNRVVRRAALVCALAGSLGVPAYGRQAPPPPPTPAGGQQAPATPGAAQQDGGPGQQDGQGRGRRGGGGFGFGRGFGPGGGGGGGGGMRDIREQLEPDFMRRDVPIFVRQLKLDDSQATVLETLMKDYEEEYQKVAGDLQNELQETGQQVFQNIMPQGSRDRMMTEMQNMQEDLRKLAEEKGGELDSETRRAFIRDRMLKMQQQMAEERKGTGADAALKQSLGTMFEKLTAWQVQKATMRTHFIDGLKASLSDEQLAQWPAFERFLTREKTLPRGRLSGEGTNLIFVLDELKLPEEDFAKVEKLLDPYELKLDAALIARNENLASSTAKLFKALQEGNVKDCERIFDRQMQLRAAVRDVNEDYRTQMVAAFGESEAAKKFEKAALLDGYDRIYRSSTTERSFDKALELEGLDPAVRQGIADLRAQYFVELDSRNRDILSTVKKNEPSQQATEAGRFATFMAAAMSGDFSALAGSGFPFGPGGGRGPGGGFGGPGGDRQDDPVRVAFDSRSQFNDEYLTKLKALLTPEQVEQLPRRENRGGGPGGAGGMTRMLEALPEAQRAEIMKKVDKNGNGQIDDDERGEFFRTMRDSGVDIFGGGGGGPGGGPGGGQGGRGGAGRGQDGGGAGGGAGGDGGGGGRRGANN
ncbi:MAG: hypothetical protein U0572_04775 [Phycisphaerales bacterium]